jgi:hypothetical protein
MTASFSSPESGSGLLGRLRAGATGAAASPGRALMAWMFGISLFVATLLFVFQPIASGHSYQLGVRVTAVLGSIWYVATYRSYWLSERKLLGLALLAGLYFGVQRPLTIRANSEIIAAYGSAFAALDAGQNPYTSGTIVHHDEHGQNKLGNFNYPPVELIPYYAISKLVGRWDHEVLTVALLGLQLAACGLLYLTFRRPAAAEQKNAGSSRGPPSAARLTLAFAPLLTCFELHTNVALTLFGVAFAVYLLCGRGRAAGSLRSWALWAWFGVALLTKFLVIPLFATYALHVVSFRSFRAFGASLRGPCLSLGLCVVLMLPFGLGNVLRETLLFNLVLSERATLTTFYPNVLSGLLSWLGMPRAFPVLAVLLLGGAVLYARRLPLLHAMFFTGSVFLLVSPTPEPQYIPVMLYLALCAQLQGERVACHELGAPAPDLAQCGPQGWRG